MKQDYSTNESKTQNVTSLSKSSKTVKVVTQNNIVVGGSEIAQILPLDNMGKLATFYETIIRRYSLQGHSRELLPHFAVARCLRHRIDKNTPIEVYKAVKFNNAAYGNLQTCKSVWVCPICASKITERRRVELAEGVKNWQGRILLLTLTLQHKSNESLETIVTSLSKAYSKKFTFGENYTKIMRDFGIVGNIRTLEVTYGDNGFHPHLHILLFSERNQIDYKALHKRLYEKWEHSLQSIGRYTNQKAFNLQFSNEAIANYVTKWGEIDSNNNWDISHEMTKNPVKVAKKGGYTPFALLESSQNGNEIHGKLFQEYAKYMKGKRQLRYSEGLKELLGLLEKSDEEICNEKIEQAYLFMILSREQWKQVLGNDIRGELLQQVANGDIETVVTFLMKFGIDWDVEQFGYYNEGENLT